MVGHAAVGRAVLWRKKECRNAKALPSGDWLKLNRHSRIDASSAIALLFDQWTVRALHTRYAARIAFLSGMSCLVADGTRRRVLAKSLSMPFTVGVSSRCGEHSKRIPIS